MELELLLQELSLGCLHGYNGVACGRVERVLRGKGAVQKHGTNDVLRNLGNGLPECERCLPPRLGFLPPVPLSFSTPCPHNMCCCCKEYKRRRKSSRGNLVFTQIVELGLQVHELGLPCVDQLFEFYRQYHKYVNKQHFGQMADRYACVPT